MDAHRWGVRRLPGCSWRRAEERREDPPADGGAMLAVAHEDAGVAAVDSTLHSRRSATQVALAKTL